MNLSRIKRENDFPCQSENTSDAINDEVSEGGSEGREREKEMKWSDSNEAINLKLRAFCFDIYLFPFSTLSPPHG